MIVQNFITPKTATPNNFKKQNQDAPLFISVRSDDLDLLTYNPKNMQKVAENTTKTLLAIPVIDTFLASATKSGALSSKTKAGLITSGLWALAGLTGYTYGKFRNTVDNHSLLIHNYRKEHPVISSLVDVLAIFTIYKGAISATKNINTLLKNKYADKLAKFNDKIKLPIKEKLNNSLFNKNIISGYESYLTQNPQRAKAIKTSAMLVVPVIFAAALLRYATELNRFKRAEQFKQQISSDNMFSNTKVLNDKISLDHAEC